MFRIFLVEDDPAISGVLERQLTAWNYQVGLVQDFQDVLGDFRTFQPHLVLLDISLPYRNGYHWCEEIRKISKVPILFLSSASDNLNLIMAVNLGGDDFLAKPFDLHVLLAKVQALLRRAYDFGAPEQPWSTEAPCWTRQRPHSRMKDSVCSLTKNEAAPPDPAGAEGKNRRPGRSHAAPVGDGLLRRRNALTVNVARLRRKLEGAGLEDFITTKKGMGYRIGE